MHQYLLSPLHFVILFLTFISSHKALSNESDSIFIVQNFNRALLDKEKQDSILLELRSRFDQNRNDYSFQDNYFYHASKFNFLTGQIDSALIYAESGLALNQENNQWRAMAKFFNLKAAVFSMQGDYPESIKGYTKASRIMDYYEDHYAAALVKNNIANLFISLRDYVSAQTYAFESYTYLKSVDDTLYLPSITGVLAISELKIGNDLKGNEYADECLKMSEKYASPVGLMVGNYAKGDYYQKIEDFELAKQAYEKSLYQSVFYNQAHYALLNKIALAKIYYLAGEYNRSVELGEEALSESLGQQNENVNYSIKKYLAYAYSGQKKYQEAYELIKEVHADYLIQTDEKNREIINELLIKYETEKKEKELANQELLLTKNEVDLSRKNMLLMLLVSSLVILVVFYWFYRKVQAARVYKLQLENEKGLMQAIAVGENAERGRISNDLHDGLASSIAGIKMELELTQVKTGSESEKLIDQLTALHEEVRRISHNLMPPDFNSRTLVETLKKFCLENNSSQLEINFNSALDLKIEFEDKKSLIVFRICQELINNVRKHAKATNCFVNISLESDQLILSVEDNGQGFEIENTKQGQGISSIKTRINQLNGTIEIESAVGKGTLVIMQIENTK